MKSARGIHIHHTVKRKADVGSVILKSVIVWLLAAAWWESLFSVYKVELDKSIFYSMLLLFNLFLMAIWSISVKRYIIPPMLLAGGAAIWKYHLAAVPSFNHLANVWLRMHNDNKEGLLLFDEAGVTAVQIAIVLAILTLPILVIWTIIIFKGRGKLAAGLLILAPVILMAAEGYLPTGTSIWLLVFTTGLYFAAAGGSSGKNVLGRGAAAAALLAVLMLISSQAGTVIEHKKSLDAGNYNKIRAMIDVNIVQRLKQTQNQANEARQEDKKTEPEITDDGNRAGEQRIQSENRGYIVEEGMSDLKTLAQYRPQPAAIEGLTVERTEKPEKTVYYSRSWGGNYVEGNWETMVMEQEVIAEYYQYPEELTRLKSLCNEQVLSSLPDTEAFIRKQFEENTVYDYNPGKTPDDKDFAEYFLFDNKKGFCVHFATTAVLMYRMCGYPARYVEGYAIPAAAFKKQDNGIYVAQIKADMGHAWCEVYDNEWQIKEHTLSYEGADMAQQKPAAHTKESVGVSDKAVVKIICLIGVAGLVILVFVIQRKIRRKLKHRSFRQSAKRNQCLKIYANIYELGVFQGMKRRDPLRSESFADLMQRYREIPEEEWERIKETVLSNLFYDSIPDQSECERLLQAYETITRTVRKELKGIQKIRFYYLLCLD